MKRLLYAHRGASAERPENTLPAFARALELGANALETDAQLTRDGAVVLSHDPTGERMANVKRSIADCTLAEVRAWDVGWGFRGRDGGRPFAGRGYRMATLEELLAEFPDVVVNVDAKGESRWLVPAVLWGVRNAHAEERVRIASFSAVQLLRARRLGYEATGLSMVESGLVATLPEGALAQLSLSGRAAQWPPHAWPIHFAQRGLIERCHRLGMRVDFWTINDPDEARRLLDLGADGVMTDDPARVARAFEEHGLERFHR